jgi:hypothetical protein
VVNGPLALDPCGKSLIIHLLLGQLVLNFGVGRNSVARVVVVALVKRTVSGGGMASEASHACLFEPLLKELLELKVLHLGELLFASLARLNSF